jgi:hypothetical protein
MDFLVFLVDWLRRKNMMMNFLWMMHRMLGLFLRHFMLVFRLMFPHMLSFMVVFILV